MRHERHTNKVSELSAGGCLWGLGGQRDWVKKISKAKLISSEHRQGSISEELIEQKIFTVS